MRRASCRVLHSLTLCDVDQMTAQTRSTEVGPNRFSNQSNNCRVGKINERRLSVAHSHCAILRLSLSLRPTKEKKYHSVSRALYFILKARSHRHRETRNEKRENCRPIKNQQLADFISRNEKTWRFSRSAAHRFFATEKNINESAWSSIT